MLLEELISIGFKEEEAQKLAESSSFHHKNKTQKELIDIFDKISRTYFCTFEDVKKAILTHPPFAGLDHERVVRQKTKLGRIAKLSNEESINCLLDTPVLAGYSAKRYLAAFDIGRQLKKEGFSQDGNMLNAFFSYFIKSPYVPDSKRKRISQVVNYKEPKLLKSMRTRLKKIKNSLS